MTNFSFSQDYILLPRQRKRDKFVTIDNFVWTHSFKIAPKHNTDGIGNWLRRARTDEAY